MPCLIFVYAGIIDIPQKMAPFTLEIAHRLELPEFITACELVVQKGW